MSDDWVAESWRRHHFDDDAATLVGESSLVHAWLAVWAAAPEAPILWGEDEQWVTAAEFEARSRRAAEAMVAAGVRPGDRVLVSCAPSVAGIAAHVGALRCGAVVAPANTGFGAHELQRLVDVARPVAAVLDDPGRLARVAGAPPAVDPSLRPWAERSVVGVALDAVAAADPAMLLFTSGTTGLPKGVPISHGNLLAASRSVGTAWRWTADDCLVLALPVFHAHGLGVGVHGSLLAGGRMVLVPQFDAGVVVDRMVALGGTMLFGVPTMWGRLVAAPGVGELRRARLLVSGSAPLSEQLFAAVEAATGQRPLERYGMSETGMLASNPLDAERRAGTVGLPLPGVEMRLGSAGADGVGEVEVRGPNVFGGYLGAELRPGDGWFSTGDLGRLDDAGYLRLVSRSKELIISGGFNVYPSEVEAAIRDHAGVADVAVVGRPDDVWGERVVAFVVGDVDGTVLSDFLASRLASYKRPKQIVVLDELPRNAMGKIVKADLPA